ncbi:MAG: hypothetical protein DME08_26355 [Candidatus Rokuibacteriota bacterium]|nr:MAG: hypothetical protein DME08_26355 [Candidatus Rokubacteria bacterium]
MLGDTIGPLSGSSRCSISDPCGRSHPRRRDDDQAIRDANARVDRALRAGALALGATVEIDGIAELWYDDRDTMTRALASPEMKALHADGALFIGKIQSYLVEEKTII